MQDALRRELTAVIIESVYAAVESEVATAKMFERI